MMTRRRSQPLAWIIAFKVLKGVALCGIGALLLATRKRLPADDIVAMVSDLLHLPSSSYPVGRALRLAASLTPRREAAVALTAFGYAGLFAAEAIGLWMRAAWARWLTIIATGCLIPLECYELVVRTTMVRAGALVVSVAVVWYLVRRRDLFER